MARVRAKEQKRGRGREREGGKEGGEEQREGEEFYSKVDMKAYEKAGSHACTPCLLQIHAHEITFTLPRCAGAALNRAWVRKSGDEQEHQCQREAKLKETGQKYDHHEKEVWRNRWRKWCYAALKLQREAYGCIFPVFPWRNTQASVPSFFEGSPCSLPLSLSHSLTLSLSHSLTLSLSHSLTLSLSHSLTLSLSLSLSLSFFHGA